VNAANLSALRRNVQSVEFMTFGAPLKYFTIRFTTSNSFPDEDVVNDICDPFADYNEYE